MTDEARAVERLGFACMATAILTGILQGLWEIAHPVLITESTFASASAAQRWGYGILSAIKSVGFLAGLFGLYLAGTKRGWIVKIFMGLAVLGGVVFGVVWLVIAATAHFTLVYVLGGMWYQMIAPVALGIASLRARRISWWIGAWAIAVGVINSQIFALLKPDMALLVQGVVWLILGYIVYTSRSRA
jgi:hypothetical protein